MDLSFGSHRGPNGLVCLLVVWTLLGTARWQCFASDQSPPENSAPDSESRWTLRYRFADGETLRMTVRHRAVSDTTIAGTTQSVETATDSTKLWKVSSTTDGDTVLEHSVDNVRMHSRTSDRGRVSWDSRGAGPPPPRGRAR
jgi:hypothetical protein